MSSDAPSPTFEMESSMCHTTQQGVLELKSVALPFELRTITGCGLDLNQRPFGLK